MANEYAEDFMKLFNMTEREVAIPRVTAIICTAYIENHITDLIRQRMPGLNASLTKSLFNDAHGSLGSCSTKIDVAQALGVIDENTAEDARLIARIRNRFAHQLHVEDFEHPKVRDLVDSLLKWKTLKWIYNHPSMPVPERVTRADRFRLGALTTYFEIMKHNTKNILYPEQSPSPDKSGTPAPKEEEDPHLKGQ